MSIVNIEFRANGHFADLIADITAVNSSIGRLNASLNAVNAEGVTTALNTFGTALTRSGQYTKQTVQIANATETFGRSLMDQKLTLRQYAREFGNFVSKRESNIRKLAKQQTAMERSIIVAKGRTATGALAADVYTPTGVDMATHASKTMLARKQLQIFNKVLSDGGTAMINWGKNTQWAGRQLMVGLTIPTMIFAAASAKAFYEVDQQLVRLTKVYGNSLQTMADPGAMDRLRTQTLAVATSIASTYGIAVKETLGLAAELAATGLEGEKLMGSIEQTTRLAVLGEIDRQDAMKTTLSIQTAFKQNTVELANSINFLNAVENQTSASLQDITTAIPKAGPVVKSLGGDIKDLTLMLVAMREGGIPASEAANAIKSSLASLINPTKQTTEVLKTFGVDIVGIINNNAGKLIPTIMAFKKSLAGLDDLSRARVIEQVFGKFQFARISALLNNIGEQGSQTIQVMKLMGASTAELAAVADREIKILTESASGRFKRTWEGIQAQLIPIGEQFLEFGTKILGVVDSLLEKFNALPESMKSMLIMGSIAMAIVGPLIMMAGIFGNFLGYMIKGIATMRSLVSGGVGAFQMLTAQDVATKQAGDLLEKSMFDQAKATNVMENAVRKLVEALEQLTSVSATAATASGAAARKAAAEVAQEAAVNGTGRATGVHSYDRAAYGAGMYMPVGNIVATAQERIGDVYFPRTAFEGFGALPAKNKRYTKDDSGNKIDTDAMLMARATEIQRFADKLDAKTKKVLGDILSQDIAKVQEAIKNISPEQRTTMRQLAISPEERKAVTMQWNARAQVLSELPTFVADEKTGRVETKLTQATKAAVTAARKKASDKKVPFTEADRAQVISKAMDDFIANDEILQEAIKQRVRDVETKIRNATRGIKDATEREKAIKRVLASELGEIQAKAQAQTNAGVRYTSGGSGLNPNQVFAPQHNSGLTRGAQVGFVYMEQLARQQDVGVISPGDVVGDASHLVSQDDTKRILTEQETARDKAVAEVEKASANTQKAAADKNEKAARDNKVAADKQDVAAQKQQEAAAQQAADPNMPIPMSTGAERRGRFADRMTNVGQVGMLASMSGMMGIGGEAMASITQFGFMASMIAPMIGQAAKSEKLAKTFSNMATSITSLSGRMSILATGATKVGGALGAVGKVGSSGIGMVAGALKALPGIMATVGRAASLMFGPWGVAIAGLITALWWLKNNTEEFNQKAVAQFRDSADMAGQLGYKLGKMAEPIRTSLIPAIDDARKKMDELSKAIDELPDNDAIKQMYSKIAESNNADQIVGTLKDFYIDKIVKGADPEKTKLMIQTILEKAGKEQYLLRVKTEIEALPTTKSGLVNKQGFAQEWVDQQIEFFGKGTYKKKVEDGISEFGRILQEAGVKNGDQWVNALRERLKTTDWKTAIDDISQQIRDNAEFTGPAGLPLATTSLQILSNQRLFDTENLQLAANNFGQIGFYVAEMNGQDFTKMRDAFAAGAKDAGLTATEWGAVVSQLDPAYRGAESFADMMNMAKINAEGVLAAQTAIGRAIQANIIAAREQALGDSAKLINDAFSGVQDKANRTMQNAKKAKTPKFTDPYKAQKEAIDDKIKAEDKEIKKIKEKQDAEKKAFDARKRQLDFEKSMRDQQIKYREAIAAGDFGAAALVKNDMESARIDFNNETAQNNKQDAIDAEIAKHEKIKESLQAQKDAYDKLTEKAREAYDAAKEAADAAAEAQNTAATSALESADKLKTRFNETVAYIMNHPELTEDKINGLLKPFTGILETLGVDAKTLFKGIKDNFKEMVAAQVKDIQVVANDIGINLAKLHLNTRDIGIIARNIGNGATGLAIFAGVSPATMAIVNGTFADIRVPWGPNRGGRNPDANVHGPSVPTRHSGGPVFGGVGSDVSIIAQAGEFVQQRAAVQKYGSGMMSAINSLTYDPATFGNSGSAQYNVIVNASGKDLDEEKVAKLVMDKMRLLEKKKGGYR